MNWSSGLSWLTTRAARREGRFDDTDRADMGTAFGLDASLEPPASEPPAQASQAAPEASWQRRLVRRSEG